MRYFLKYVFYNNRSDLARASDGIRDGRQRRRGKTDVWEASYCVLVSINEKEEDDRDDDDEYYNDQVVVDDDDDDYQVVDDDNNYDDDDDAYYQVDDNDDDDDDDAYYQVDDNDNYCGDVYFSRLYQVSDYSKERRAVDFWTRHLQANKVRLVCCHRYLFTQHHS